MSLSSVAASAKRALDASKARKGDVILIEVHNVVTYAFGSGRGREVSVEYHVCRAAHCNSAGKVMEASDIGEYRSTRPEHGWVRCWTLPREHHAKMSALVGQSFDTLDAAREALRACMV